MFTFVVGYGDGWGFASPTRFIKYAEGYGDGWGFASLTKLL
ncbi:MAG: hypothetical protein ACMUIM_06735 [bacterium]